MIRILYLFAYMLALETKRHMEQNWCDNIMKRNHKPEGDVVYANSKDQDYYDDEV